MQLRTGTQIGIGLAAGAALFHLARRRRETGNIQPAGDPKHPDTVLLEAGSRLLQSMAPLSTFNVYLAGFHPMKDDPHHQMEAHHFCRQVNEDLMQCILFSGNTPDALLNGIEYIISERLFETLPPEERQYWHPHNYEILSGTLVAPGVPAAAEHAFMAKKMNSYGKTWHTWRTGSADQPGESIPLGPAMLAWSFNRDGELRGCILEAMEAAMGISTAGKRREREDLAALAHPQEGVDVLRGAFPQAADTAPGVTDKNEVQF